MTFCSLTKYNDNPPRSASTPIRDLSTELDIYEEFP